MYLCGVVLRNTSFYCYDNNYQNKHQYETEESFNLGSCDRHDGQRADGLRNRHAQGSEDIVWDDDGGEKDIMVPMKFSAKLKGQADVTITPQVSGQP